MTSKSEMLRMIESSDPQLVFRSGRDMGGPWLMVSCVDDDGMTETYSVSLERV